MREITVLRLNHRKRADRRLSTHLGLIARAFGAKRLVLPERDERVKDSIDKVSENWGGDFEIVFMPWKKALKKFPGKIVHLTMYGEKIDSVSLPKGDCIIAVGGEKVPREIYDLADLNIAVSNQPHSEAGALAITLDRIFEGKELEMNFRNAKKKIIPRKNGKEIEEL